VAAKRTKRRPPGEGSVWQHSPGRYSIGYKVTDPDGSTRRITRRRSAAGEHWTTHKAAAKALREELSKLDRGEWADPSRQPVAAYLGEWLDGLRLTPGTVASYRRNVRLHLVPYIGAVPLASLTTARIDGMYRKLESSGRRGHDGELAGAALSARTVRYVATILHSALAAAVDSRRLAVNPAARAHPPTAKQARAPEMHPWTAGQLAAFLSWSAGHSADHAAWTVLAMTGMRRGELLALRWRDLSGSALAVRRSAGIVRDKGERGAVTEGPTKTDRPRVIDLDPSTVAVLRARRRERGGLALELARDDALIFGDIEGRHRNPETFSRRFRLDTALCRETPAGTAVPPIRLHDLRHTHATLLLGSGVPVKVVSERLGHASPMVTLTVYAHVMPGNQRDAADLFAGLIKAAGT